MKKGTSIKVKTAITTVFFMGILTAAIAVIGYKLYHDSVMERYVDYTETVLEYSYRTAEKYSFGDMIAQRSMPEDYEKLRADLNEIKDSSDIEYLYAMYFEDTDRLDGLCYAINAKTREELNSGKPLSEIYTYMGVPVEEGAFEEETLEILRRAVADGKRENGTLEGYSERYGHMLNGYRVIFDSSGKPAGLICVEIDINRINSGVHRYIRMVILTASVLTALIVIIYLLNTRRYLIGPVERIAESSDQFVKQMQSGTEPEKLVFKDPEVKSKGELKLLADNVRSLAEGVSSYMINLKTVTAERERIGTELELARKIQADMLPNIFPAFPGRSDFDIYATMTPAKEVGGDFYDFFLIDDDHLCMVMGDVSGKGVPAALYMMMSKIIINNFAVQGNSPARVLELTNDLICQNNDDEVFVTLWIGVLEMSTGRVVSANAGHEYPVLRNPDGEFELLKTRHDFVLGGLEGMTYQEHEFKLEKGAALFLYTDGIPEAINVKDEAFGTGRLLEALNSSASADPRTLIANVKKAVDDFVGDAEQFDDMTMLVMKLFDN